jgi:hypothetical protein
VEESKVASGCLDVATTRAIEIGGEGPGHMGPPQVEEAMGITLDLEPLLKEADRLLQTASLLNGERR